MNHIVGKSSAHSSVMGYIIVALFALVRIPLRSSLQTQGAGIWRERQFSKCVSVLIIYYSL